MTENDLATLGSVFLIEVEKIGKILNSRERNLIWKN